VTERRERATGGVVFTTSDDHLRASFWGVVNAEVRSRSTGQLWSAWSPAQVCEIDCRPVLQMDSLGLSVFVRLVRDAIEAGCDVRFLGASEQVADLLETTGVDAWMRGLGVRDG